MSIREGKCLVREGSSIRDRDYHDVCINPTCLECNTQHKWHFQQGFLDAIVIGRYDRLVADSEYPVLELLLADVQASHTCHNSRCSDPFHVEWEAARINVQGNLCRPPHSQPCHHTPRCRLELEWSSRIAISKEVAIEVQEECRKERGTVVRPSWRCSAKCVSKGSKDVFVRMNHWQQPGCKRGGQPVPV